MLGQLLMRFGGGKNLFQFSDFMPFGETSITLDKWDKNDKDFINANYIKTVFQESHPRLEDSPFGLMIATCGPKNETV